MLTTTEPDLEQRTGEKPIEGLGGIGVYTMTAQEEIVQKGVVGDEADPQVWLGENVVAYGSTTMRFSVNESLDVGSPKIIGSADIILGANEGPMCVAVLGGTFRKLHINGKQVAPEGYILEAGSEGARALFTGRKELTREQIAQDQEVNWLYDPDVQFYMRSEPNPSLVHTELAIASATVHIPAYGKLRFASPLSKE